MSGYGDTDPRYRGREPDREEPEEPGNHVTIGEGGGGGEHKWDDKRSKT